MQKLYCQLSLLVGLSVFSQVVFSAQQTTPYIAIHSKPKYLTMAAMPYADPNAPKGGVLSQAAQGTFDNLNSMNGKGNATEGVNYLFDTLMTQSLNEVGVLYPLLAEKVSYDPERTQSVTFYLNPKARFSNGQPLTAADVKFSFDVYQTKSNFGLQMYLADLAKTEVINPHQVRFTFKSSHNPKMPFVVASLPIYSKADWQNRDFTRITLQPIVGSGPYVVEKIDAGRSISYKRNPNYWAKDLPINKGRYNFDHLKYVYYRNWDIAFEGFKSGQYTLHEETNPKKWVTDYKFPAVKAGLVTLYKFRHHNPIATESYVFNTRRKPLNDIRFRQALTYAYDFEWQNKALFYGQYQRLQSYFENSELAATGRPSKSELTILKPLLPKLSPVMQKAVLADWKYPVSDASGFNRQNLLIARQLLIQAGYKIKEGQLYTPEGKPVQIEFLIQQDGKQRTLMPFVRNLKKLGINIQLRQVDAPQYLERTRRYDFDMTTMNLPQSLNPGNEQAQFWGSAAAIQDGNYNYAGIRNSVIDEVISKLVTAKDREQQIIYTHVLDRLLRAGYYQIPTYGKGDYWYAYWNMYQQPKVKPVLSAGIEYWWSNPNQAKKVAQYLHQQ
ncbi:extracellular solute-binding protein [Acinetobacter sp. V110_1]|uniref:extracellular solute-binding protein n=1 Tax=Acinetobacter sp. V110_1 TaxID=3072988 RepID=UPI00287F15C6|nr:extracellular solute-binding protein [Acinetobacter sp. V110_1]MDS7945533.1 extracellular solute-binding protein [Acinetobacter sp. V110_1]